MDFQMTEERKLIQNLAREFARNEIAPIAARCDQEARFPMDVFHKLRDVGLVNLTIPEAYGGPGLGGLEVVLVTEQLGWGCAGITGAIGINTIVADVFHSAGTEAQRQRIFGRLLDGEWGAYAVTEPSAGSDVAGIKTRAEKRGDRYVLNGSKIWISNAPLAQFFVVFAKTDAAAGHRGVSAFIVNRDDPGLALGKSLGKLGQRAAPAGEVFFNDIQLPTDRLIGDEGHGFMIAMKVFDRSRPMVGALALSLATRCLDEAVGYARERHTMGKPIIEHQAIGHKLADMGVRVEASRLLVYQAAALLDAGQPNTLQAAYAKLFAADSAMFCATEAVQVFGGMGYSTEYPVEKLFRDAKVLQIYEGTSEIQKSIIARELARR
ncbi:MAG: acyl-CoA dehydrogenase family protein [Burkholderiales bacterium]|nr:acyl-CoA dehydrogenase family protein [Burkholderiales bacterium]